MAKSAYRLDFCLICLSVLLLMLLTLIFVKTIYGFIDNLASWNYAQALLIVASYMLVEGLMWTSCAYLNVLHEYIKTGFFDFILTKPKDAQFLITVARGDPEDWGRIITALIVFTYAIKQLNMPLAVMLLRLPVYLVLIICAYFIIYSINLMIKSLAFWFTDVKSLWYISNTITQMSQYPTDIFFHKIVRMIFSTIIPLAFLATVPAKALVEGPKFYLLASAILLAAAFFMISRQVWLLGIKNYSSASS